MSYAHNSYLLQQASGLRSPLNRMAKCPNRRKQNTVQTIVIEATEHDYQQATHISSLSSTEV